MKAGENDRLIPESLPLSRTDGFLLDDMDATLCWSSLVGPGSGFGWDRGDGRTIKNLPRLPGPVLQEFKIRSLLTVSFDQAGQPTGRIFLLNAGKPFQKQDLAWLESIAQHIGPALENIFLLRHLRARAIEAERSRIARDLHDGILQTLLSIEIQLDVMRRRLPAAPDLLMDSAQLRAPNRVCREIFQIYREALNNIKKQAKASHVVVKLSQDDSRLVLVVDDNGEGFSFAGRFTGDELDRLRLGPISIKERARTVGGVLTVESSPGHGARLTIEVPLG